MSAMELRIEPTGSGPLCHAILATLPTWFGIPEAKADYVTYADVHPTIVARVDGADVGLTVYTRHFAESAEVHLIAVMPEHHRRGVGTAMLRHAEASLAAEGVRFLQVKTLSAARVDAGYDKTRAFYLAYGFTPLEEFPELWDPSNPALQLVKTVASARVISRAGLLQVRH